MTFPRTAIVAVAAVLLSAAAPSINRVEDMLAKGRYTHVDETLFSPLFSDVRSGRFSVQGLRIHRLAASATTAELAAVAEEQHCTLAVLEQLLAYTAYIAGEESVDMYALGSSRVDPDDEEIRVVPVFRASTGFRSIGVTRVYSSVEWHGDASILLHCAN